MITIPDAPLEQWLAPLKKYQRDQVEQLLKAYEPIEVARLWISADGPLNTLGFGGTGGGNPFFDSLQTEFRKFVCDDPKYNEERKQLATGEHIAEAVLIAVISGAIAVHLCVMATLIVPSVAILLHVAGKVGINAWCSEQSISEEIKPD